MNRRNFIKFGLVTLGALVLNPRNVFHDFRYEHALRLYTTDGKVYECKHYGDMSITIYPQNVIFETGNIQEKMCIDCIRIFENKSLVSEKLVNNIHVLPGDTLTINWEFNRD